MATATEEKTDLQVFAGRDRYEDVCKASIQRLPTTLRRKVKLTPFKRWDEADITGAGIVVAVYALSELSGELKFRGGTRHVIFVEGMPVEALADKLVKLGVRSGKRLHLAHETEYEDVAGVVFRVLAGSLELDSSESRIVDAWVEDGTLVLLPPSFQRMSVPIERLHKLLGTNDEEISSFDIDEDGSFLYWPHADVHLGWEQLQCLIDPQTQLRQKQLLDGYNERYGAAIRSLRKKSNLNQSDIKGINPRTLGRVEQGQAAASSSTLQALAMAHSMSLNDYMEAVAKNME